MSDRQSAKAIARRYFAALESQSDADLARAVAQTMATDYRMKCVHPFNEQASLDAALDNVWRPLRQSFTALQRREDIFFAGPDRTTGSMWVTSMGKFLGLLDRDWIGIPATGRIVMIPYCEFLRIDGDKIVESAIWFDIINVMKQAGLQPLPVQTGAELVYPGPRGGNGILLEPQDDAESQQTLDLIMQMCSDLVDKDGFQSSNSSLAETWHDDMLWFGPSGIGATYTIARYQVQHQTPFRLGLRDIEFTGHLLEHAEGEFGSWFGWPSLRMKHGDGYLGLPASDTVTEMRVVDVYRRQGDKLLENWIFIDFLHYLKILGLDVLERCASIGRDRR